MKVMHVLSLVVLIFSGFSVGAYADSSVAIKQMQTRWAQVNYQLEGDEQLKAYEQLLSEADAYKSQYKTDAGILIWSGIVKSSYAGAKGGLGALKFAKSSRIDLEAAMKLDATALSGSAYTSLGVLYDNVPGWPISFGSSKKADELLRRALEINPDGIDPNYFYGKFLHGDGDYVGAQKYYLKAQQAPPRLSRPLADSGRQKEISMALSEVKKELQ
jgi:tetratricopeptide (TPR) repeat protein